MHFNAGTHGTWWRERMWTCMHMSYVYDVCAYVHTTYAHMCSHDVCAYVRIRRMCICVHMCTLMRAYARMCMYARIHAIAHARKSFIFEVQKVGPKKVAYWVGTHEDPFFALYDQGVCDYFHFLDILIFDRSPTFDDFWNFKIWVAHGAIACRMRVHMLAYAHVVRAYVLSYVCTYVCMYAHVCTYALMRAYMRMRVRICAYMFAYTSTCVHKCVAHHCECGFGAF